MLAGLFAIAVEGDLLLVYPKPYSCIHTKCGTDFDEHAPLGAAPLYCLSVQKPVVGKDG